jgi:hypothetical protein
LFTSTNTNLRGVRLGHHFNAASTARYPSVIAKIKTAP